MTASFDTAVHTVAYPKVCAQHQTLFWGAHTECVQRTSLFGGRLVAALDADTTLDATAPSVSVIFSVMENCLHLSFIIQKMPWLTLSPFAPIHLKHSDFLWQHDCLECFVEFDNQQGYSEINFAPNGNYAIYQFDNYRTPDTLPPKRGSGNLFVPNGSFDDADYWVRHFAVQFAHRQKPSKIHPTTILYRHDTPIYYALSHASPPNFHDKTHWRSHA